MNITTMGIDLAKDVFHLVGMDNFGHVIFKKKVSRAQLTRTLRQFPPCLVGMEACGSSHYWARVFVEMGHKVKLMAPQFVKPYVKTNKNDFNDAEAIAEAVTRPTMRFVTVKTIAQQDIQLLHQVRSRLMAERTALINQIRGLLAEYGIVLPVSAKKVVTRLSSLLEPDDRPLSALAREVFSDLWMELRALEDRIASFDRKIDAVFRTHPVCQKIAHVEGIGPLTATAFIATIGDPHLFKNGRHLSAFLGLVPRQHASGGKSGLGPLSKRGDVYLRTLLIHGGRAVVRSVASKTDGRSRWVHRLVDRRGKNIAAVAVANKNARILWALLVKDEPYRKAS